VGIEEERMSDSVGRRTTRCAAALALAAFISLAVTANSDARPNAAVTPAVSAASTPTFSRLPFVPANRGVQRGARSLPSRKEATLPAHFALGAQRAAAGTPCGQTPGLLCSQLDVPLDRTGVMPGVVSLHVETLPAFGPSRGVVFLIAGGPGQGSAHVFNLGTPADAQFYRYLFPGYTLVAYDDRGTGASGVLRCPALQASPAVDAEAGLAAACADVLGPQRDFYSTHEHAEDLEAVRLSLGVDKVALWGTSYGTKLALAYALAHPDHVERLLLDSVVPTDRDSYESTVFQQLPGTLGAFCGGGLCRGATSDFAGEVVSLANALAAAPAQAKVLQTNGTRRTVRLSGLALVSAIVDADLSPGLAAELPAAVHAARQGNLLPLLRLFELDSQSSVVPDEDLSSGLYAATVCRDGPFPWQPDTPIADRPALLASALGALPAGAFGPFGNWAAGFGNAAFCLQWPSPAGGAALGPGPLPNVPVLAVSGGFDMRTPTVGATQVAALFPQGRVLVVPGVGHSVLGADVSFCAQRAVHDWMLGGQPPTSCPRPQQIVGIVSAYAPATVPKKAASPGRTVALVSQTLRDAEAMWLTSSPGEQIAGVYAGRLSASDRGFTLVRYSVAPGVEVSGKLRIGASGLPLKFQGTVTVAGRAAAAGVLGVSANKLAGTLAGRIVRG
jgi:pimeloyl-ACP methyl ester carboxylesterase